MIALTIGVLALSPVRYCLPNPGDSFRYSIVDHYSYPGSPTGQDTGIETDVFSSATYSGKASMKDVIRDERHAYGRSQILVFNRWVSVSSSRIQTLAASEGTRPPIRMRGQGFTIPSSMKPGTSWLDEGRSDAGFTFKTHSTVLRQERVTVPAGTFQCWVVHRDQTQTAHGQTENVSGNEWWSPTTRRPVKSDLVETDPPDARGNVLKTHITLSLLSYRHK